MIHWYQNLPLWVTFVPLLGALLLLLVPKGQRRVFELGALAVTVIDTESGADITRVLLA